MDLFIYLNRVLNIAKLRINRTLVTADIYCATKEILNEREIRRKYE